MGDVTEVWVDGSCLGNGIENASSAVGVYYGVNDERNFSSKLSGTKQTNNRAELLAILYVLCTNHLTANLRIYTDSQYSIKCLTEYHHKWKSNGWTTSKGDRVESVNIIKYTLNFLARREAKASSTELCHVKGHSNDPGNTAADMLANTAAHHVSEQSRVRLLRYFGAPF